MTRAQPTPTAYAAGKLPTMRARWSSAPGDAVRRMGPVMWPEVPPAALMGLTANAVNASERYCDGFCAVGLYQTPEATWTRLRDTPSVRTLLGRAAAPVSDFATDVDGQTAIGLLDYRLAAGDTRDALPVALRPTVYGTLWHVWLGAMGYVVGAGGAANVLNLYLGDVTQSPEQLPTTLVQRVAATGSRQSAYPTLRAWQRLATGKALASSLGQSVTWWDSLPPSSLEQPLDDTYNNDAPAGADAVDMLVDGMSARTKFALVWAAAAAISLGIDVFNNRRKHG